MSKCDACPVCGVEFKRAGGLKATGGKCPNCGLLIQILGPGERPTLDKPDRTPAPDIPPPYEAPGPPPVPVSEEPFQEPTFAAAETEQLAGFDEPYEPEEAEREEEKPADHPTAPADEEYEDWDSEPEGGFETAPAGPLPSLSEMPKWAWAVAGAMQSTV